MKSKFQLSNQPGFVPNLKTAKEEWGTYNLTNFQMHHAEEIRARSDFAHWVSAGPIDPIKDGERRKGTICITYYTDDGVLRVSRVGMRSILQTVPAEK